METRRLLIIQGQSSFDKISLKAPQNLRKMEPFRGN